MASAFLGISVAVTLQNPPNTIVQGTVAAVNEQTSTLTLQNGLMPPPPFHNCTHGTVILTCMAVFFPASGHRLPSYHVEGHAIADIKMNVPPAPTHPLPPRANTSPYPQYPPSHTQQVPLHPGAPVQLPAAQRSVQHVTQPIRPPVQPAAQPAPFVDPAILSMGKRTSTAPLTSQLVAAPPQEAPATPIKPNSVAHAASVAKTAPQFAHHMKGHNVRKPSAATLEGPFSSLDIADAEEADSETKRAPSDVRRASITKTRNGKPMDDPSPQKLDDAGKKTRRGGKSRKKELAAQERKNGGDALLSPDAVRKGYVLFHSNLCRTNIS
jgi:enhancer of mRNA-decapping protein 3